MEVLNISSLLPTAHTCPRQSRVGLCCCEMRVSGWVFSSVLCVCVCVFGPFSCRLNQTTTSPRRKGRQQQESGVAIIIFPTDKWLQCVGELSQCQIIRRSGGVWLFWEDGHSFCVCVCVCRQCSCVVDSSRVVSTKNQRPDWMTGKNSEKSRLLPTTTRMD